MKNFVKIEDQNGTIWFVDPSRVDAIREADDYVSDIHGETECCPASDIIISDCYIRVNQHAVNVRDLLQHSEPICESVYGVNDVIERMITEGFDAVRTRNTNAEGIIDLDELEEYLGAVLSAGKIIKGILED